MQLNGCSTNYLTDEVKTLIISEMQRKLATWAQENATFKADRLLRLIHPVWLQIAERALRPAVLVLPEWMLRKQR